MTYYHATTYRLSVDDVLLPANEAGVARGNVRMRTPEAEDVEYVWMTEDPDEAAGWVEHSWLKFANDDFLAMPTPGYFIYTVEPEGPVYVRTDPHSPTECGAKRARIVAVEHVDLTEDFRSNLREWNAVAEQDGDPLFEWPAHWS